MLSSTKPWYFHPSLNNKKLWSGITAWLVTDKCCFLERFLWPSKLLFCVKLKMTLVLSNLTRRNVGINLTKEESLKTVTFVDVKLSIMKKPSDDDDHGAPRNYDIKSPSLDVASWLLFVVFSVLSVSALTRWSLHFGCNLFVVDWVAETFGNAETCEGEVMSSASILWETKTPKWIDFVGLNSWLIATCRAFESHLDRYQEQLERPLFALNLKPMTLRPTLIEVFIGFEFLD